MKMVNESTTNSWQWLVGGGGLVVLLACIGNIYSKLSNEKETTKKEIDKVKSIVDETYTKKEICVIVHTQVKETLEDLKVKVECIPKIKVGIDLLLKKNGLSNPE